MFLIYSNINPELKIESIWAADWIVSFLKS